MGQSAQALSCRPGDWKTTKRLKVLFFSVCATIASVALWVIVIVLNVIRALFGETVGAMRAGWAFTLLSTGIFFVVFYKHFSKTET